MLQKITFALCGILVFFMGFFLSKWLYTDSLTPVEQVEELIERRLAATGQLPEKTEDEIRAENGEKVFKKTPKIGIYETSYYTFENSFLTHLKGSRNFVQFTIGVSTQYDTRIIENVERHELALRSVILNVVSEFTYDELSSINGRELLADSIMKELNRKLEKLERFGGIENVYFTAFTIQ